MNQLTRRHFRLRGREDMRTVEPIMNTLFTITELQLKPHKHSIRHLGGFQTHLRHRHIQM